MSNWTDRARALVIRETGDKFHINEGLLEAFGKELQKAYSEGVATADVLADEAQSYVDIGHAISDEDKPLQKAIDDHRNRRTPQGSTLSSREEGR